MMPALISFEYPKSSPLTIKLFTVRDFYLTANLFPQIKQELIEAAKKMGLLNETVKRFLDPAIDSNTEECFSGQTPKGMVSSAANQLLCQIP